MNTITSATSSRKINRTLAPHRRARVRCPSCARTVERRARQQQYCSPRCRERGRERSRKALLGVDTGAPRNPLKTSSENKALQRAKTLSRVDIVAPVGVIVAEVFSRRVWRESISSGGVRIEVGRVRARALVGAISDDWRDWPAATDEAAQ